MRGDAGVVGKWLGMMGQLMGELMGQLMGELMGQLMGELMGELMGAAGDDVVRCGIASK